jgi:HAMP domain-containing protein
MPASTEQHTIGEPASEAGRKWLAHSVWNVPDLEVSRLKSWSSITAVSSAAADQQGSVAGAAERMRDYVEAHLGDDLSLTALAEIARLSP